MSHNNLSCLQAQFDEIEALQSIYGEAWKPDEFSPGCYSIDIEEESFVVNFFVHLSDGYPLECPPTYTISAPALTTDQKNYISSMLDDEYLKNIGESVLYQWIENIREYLIQLGRTDRVQEPLNVPLKEALGECTNETSTFTPEIFHGDVITDRKSSFQGHVAKVMSISQVEEVLRVLKSNKKVSNATHNMFAYRILLTNNRFMQDCEDDGEAQAGGRLLHLLQIVGVKNVMVIVSRWYGGILLGSDRFRHINNAARQVLQANGFISPPKYAYNPRITEIYKLARSRVRGVPYTMDAREK